MHLPASMPLSTHSELTCSSSPLPDWTPAYTPPFGGKGGAIAPNGYCIAPHLHTCLVSYGCAKRTSRAVRCTTSLRPVPSFGVSAEQWVT